MMLALPSSNAPMCKRQDAAWTISRRKKTEIGDRISECYDQSPPNSKKARTIIAKLLLFSEKFFKKTISKSLAYSPFKVPPIPVFFLRLIRPIRPIYLIRPICCPCKVRVKSVWVAGDQSAPSLFVPFVVKNLFGRPLSRFQRCFLPFSVLPPPLIQQENARFMKLEFHAPRLTFPEFFARCDVRNNFRPRQTDVFYSGFRCMDHQCAI
jgi:hypothetical protein